MEDTRVGSDANVRTEERTAPLVDVFRCFVDTDSVEVPSVIDTLDRLRSENLDLEDPRVSLALPRSAFIEFAFWSRNPEFEQVASKLLRGERGYVEVLRDGIWNRIATWLDDFDEIGREPSLDGTRVAIGEIHIPHIGGCVGSFATTRTGTLTVSIKVVGVGGGRSRRMTLGNVLEVPAACRAMTTGIAYEITLKQHRFSGQLIALCRILWLDGNVVDEALDPSIPHPCADDYLAAKVKIPSIAAAAGLKRGDDYTDLPLRSSSAEHHTTKMSLELGTLYSASLTTPAATLRGMAIPTIEFQVESEVTKTVEMTWKVVKAHDYMWYRLERRDMRIFWAWK